MHNEQNKKSFILNRMHCVQRKINPFAVEEELDGYLDISNICAHQQFSSSTTGLSIPCYKKNGIITSPLKLDHTSTSIRVVIRKIEGISFVTIAYPFFQIIAIDFVFCCQLYAYVCAYEYFSFLVFLLSSYFRIVNRMKSRQNCTVCSNSSSHSHSSAFC